MTKYKPYLIYKPSGVEWLDELPKAWRVAPLKRYSSYISRGMSPNYSENDEGVPIINQACIHWEGLKLENVKIQDVLKSSGQRGRLYPGDLLINSTGTGTLGRVGVFDLNGEYLADSHITIVRTTKSLLEKFLYYLLQTDLYQGYIYSAIVTGATNQIELSREGLGNTPIIVPPLQEQEMIANFLDCETTRIDTLITKKREMIDLLEKKRAAIVTEAVTKGCNRDVPLKKGEVEWLNEVPARWKVARLKFLAHSIQTGPFGSQLHSDDYSPGGIPVINPLHLSNGRIYPDFDVAIDDETWQRLSRHELQEGDIVFARRGEIGRCGLVTSIEAGWLCGTGSMRLRPNQNVVLPSFIIQVLSTRGAADQLLLDSVGSTMDNLNTKTLSNLLLPVPPPDEQKTIIKYLKQQTESLDDLIKKIEESIDEMTRHRQALITAAVTGKIDVQEKIKSDRGVA